MVKVVALQRFSDGLVAQWLQLLHGEDVSRLYEAILNPQSSASQLKAVKKVSRCYQHAHMHAVSPSPFLTSR